MTKENENSPKSDNESIIQNSTVEEAFQKGLKQGRIEGMIAYQQRIIKNLQTDNEKLNMKLKETVK